MRKIVSPAGGSYLSSLTQNFVQSPKDRLTGSAVFDSIMTDRLSVVYKSEALGHETRPDYGW
jgi:hypothetical protein